MKSKIHSTSGLSRPRLPRWVGQWSPTLANGALICAVGLTAANARADETCMSPYMPKITGQEEFVYVWTLGVDGWGDSSDKLVTIDVRPSSSNYGQVVHTVPVGGQHEAHHGGFTDDRRELWLSGLDSSHIFIFDVASDPSRPELKKTIKNFAKKTGAVGPHGFYALPGRMLVPCLSNAKDQDGRTAIVEYSNDGRHIATHWMPTSADTLGAEIEQEADGYGYDARVLPRKNVMLSSSFTGWKNYMRAFGDLVQDAEAMKQFGQTMVLWNFHTRQPRKVFHVPGVPLEVRWAWGPNHNYAFTATALGSQIWLIYEDEMGVWQAKDVGHVGPEGHGVLPVDISLSANDQLLFVDCFGDGKCRVYDVANPHQPTLVHEQTIGRQVNMVSQSWDGRRPASGPAKEAERRRSLLSSPPCLPYRSAAADSECLQLRVAGPAFGRHRRPHIDPGRLNSGLTLILLIPRLGSPACLSAPLFGEDVCSAGRDGTTYPRGWE